MRRVLKAKSCQQIFIKKPPGRLDKPHLIFKSRKTLGIKQNIISSINLQFIALLYSFLYLLLMKKEEKTKQQTKQKKLNYHSKILI